VEWIEVDVLRLDDIEGGFSGLALSGPDDRTYVFALRPLLPDEAYQGRTEAQTSPGVVAGIARP